MAETGRNNYVTPLGDFYVGTKHRFFGNRGPLHKDGRVVRDWVNKRWLVCVTDDLGPPETFMSPGHHTELFFLDEATALAAGQRPCYQCRKAAFNEFISLFDERYPLTSPRAPAMDEILHSHRLDKIGERRTFEAPASELVDGVFLLKDSAPWLLFGGSIHRWSPTGYDERSALPSGEVQVLTPRCTVDVIAAGYRPDVDPSART